MSALDQLTGALESIMKGSESMREAINLLGSITHSQAKRMSAMEERMDILQKQNIRLENRLYEAGLLKETTKES